MGPNPAKRPKTFNFAGRTGSYSNPNYHNGIIKVGPQTVPKRLNFHPHVPRNKSGFRYAYLQYNRTFLDSWFLFTGYRFRPYEATVCSPWYFYPQLPPYLAISVVFISAPPSYGDWNEYRWVQPDSQLRAGALDEALWDIATAYEEHDSRAIERLMPVTGNVAIYLDGQYRYSVRAADFNDMLVDSISDVRTTRYEVLQVRRYRDGSFWMEARHDSTDPWGLRTTVYQTMRLVPYGNDYVIREFGTSADSIP